MKRLGDGEISGKTDSGEGTTPLSFTGLQVGASLTDLLMGSQPDQIKLGSKTNSLETADSALFAAILAGDTEFVQRRMNSTGNMGEGAALLLVKTRQKSAEQNFITKLLAHAALTVVEAAKKEEDSRFTRQNAIIANYDLREQRRIDGEQSKKTDIYGGFLEGTGLYHDRFGGTYDNYGYTFANGDYQTRTGEFVNKLLNTITLVTGEVYKAPEGMEAKTLAIGAVINKEVKNALHKHFCKVPGLHAFMEQLEGERHSHGKIDSPAASMDAPASSSPGITSKMAGNLAANKAVAAVESVEHVDAEAEQAAEGMIASMFGSIKRLAAAATKPGGALSFLRQPGDAPLTVQDLEETAGTLSKMLGSLKKGATQENKEMMQQAFVNEVLAKVPAEMLEKFVEVLESDSTARERGYAQMARKFLSDNDHNGLRDGVEQVAEKAQRAVLETASKIDREFKEAAAKGPGIAQDVLKYNEPEAETTTPKASVTLTKGPHLMKRGR